MTALSTLRQALDANVPAILWGPPGIGKTARIEQEAARRDWAIETVISSIRQPDDFAGLPWINGGGVVMVPPDWGERLAKTNKPAILFLDEVSCAPPATQGALLRVVLERVVGDLCLPSHVRVLAAANPPEQSAGGWDLSMPLANRLLHINWPTPSIGEWSHWAMSPIAQLPQHGAALVASFLTRRPELLLDVPDNETSGGMAWPSPRSWAMAASLLAPTLDLSTIAQTIVGCVGEGPAAEFTSFVVDANQLRDPEELLADPSSWEPDPDRLDLVFATMHSVVSAVTAASDTDTESPLTPTRWDAAWALLNTAREIAPDSVFAVGSILARAGAMRSDLDAPQWLAGLVPLLDEIEAA